jgi:hypothetical protein
MLGMCVAMLAARSGSDVLVCRMPDAQVPHADTLRNQSWLQSGLRYVSTTTDVEARLVFAKRMRAARQLLHDELGLPMPAGFGVFRARDDADAARLEQSATLFGVGVDELSEQEAKAIVGPFVFEAGSRYFATPETRFDEATVLDELRARVAGHRGVRELTSPIALTPDTASPGYVAEVGSTSLRATTTVLAAGAGNVPLLEQLGLPAELAIDQTPLLVVPRCDLLASTSVFVDRVRRYSIVSHPPTEAMPDGACVIGVDETTQEDVQFAAPQQRKLPVGTASRMWASLPAGLQSFAASSRLTAGFEIRHAAVSSSSQPWISAPYSGYAGLVASIPGRATLSMSVAQEVVARISGGARAPRTSTAYDGTEWTAPIRMHHEPYYRNLNDV